MDHVNNAVYADWLEEQVLTAAGVAGAATIGSIPRLARLEYARAAEPRAVVDAMTWSDPAGGGGWSCRLSDPATGKDLLRARLEPS
jgi:acyl-ACP thioesterase